MKNYHSSLSAFSLVEVTLALGIAAFALLSIFGLLPIGMSSNQASVEQTIATNIVTGIMADLRETPTVSAIAGNAALNSQSPKYHLDVTLPSHTFFLDQSGARQTSAATARYKAILTLTVPQTGTRTATYGTLKIGWPAEAATSLGSVTTCVALDRN